MRTERLVESRSSVVELSPGEAASLVGVGRRLASQATWSTDPGGGPRSAVQCEPYGHGRWNVRVPNAVGVVRVEGLQLVVEPKIPLAHLLHLFERSGAFPRLDTSVADLSTAESLWPLVAGWYVASVERLLRSGLSSGYRDATADLAAARGRILAAATGRTLMKGGVSLRCEYQEFDVDTPLNRVLRAAAVAVMASPALGWGLRQRASRAVDHMEGVGRLLLSDFGDARPERHTSRYDVPVQLARHVLSATGRGLDAGDEYGYAFLIRTPEMAEEGLRRIAQAALADRTEVAKRTKFLRGSHHSLTPDVVFGTDAVGDVKYRLWAGDWDRTDLYQLVAFATGFAVEHAVRLGFAPEEHGTSPVRVGGVRLSTCDWTCDRVTSPAEAEAAFASRLLAWWSAVRGGQVG